MKVDLLDIAGLIGLGLLWWGLWAVWWPLAPLVVGIMLLGSVAALVTTRRPR